MAIEQLYPLQVAAEVIPMSSVHALYMFLGRNQKEFPGRYQKVGSSEVRLLSESEILKIREMTITGKAESRHATAGRPSSRNAALAAIMRQAYA